MTKQIFVQLPLARYFPKTVSRRDEINRFFAMVGNLHRNIAPVSVRRTTESQIHIGAIRSSKRNVKKTHVNRCQSPGRDPGSDSKWDTPRRPRC